MRIEYRKSISIDIACEDESTIIASRKNSGMIMRLENFIEKKNCDVVAILPGNVKIMFDAASMLEACKKIIALQKI